MAKKKKRDSDDSFKQVGALFRTKKRGMLVGTIKDTEDYSNFSDLKELVDEADAEVGITIFAFKNEDSDNERAPLYRLSGRIAEEYNGNGKSKGKKKKSRDRDDDSDDAGYEDDD